MRWGVLTGPRGFRLAVEICESPAERRHGLLGRDRLEPGRGLLIPWARSVHTIGMRFPLLVLFLDGRLVVRRVHRMPPGRLALPRLRIRHVLELPDPGPDCVTLRPGDRLMLERAPREALARPPG